MGEILATILWLYFLVLLARFVIDLVQLLSPDWKPKGPILVIAEVVYTLTDPPLKFLRRIIPPLKIGSIALDLSFLVLILGIQVLIAVALALPI
ncbi:MAG: YggT family protein [Candidatus Nanopelagicales bacterium]